ncbi:MAG: carbohydrate porin, partial [Phycisphaerae bacterium]|nr:carbohydrate porin [Phycisphaerae bacterium]
MTKTIIAGTLALVLCALPALAQDAAQETTTETTVSSTSYETGSWFEWKKMTGDWGGVRTDLANKGITLDIDYTQVFQGNAHGGADTNNAFRESGSGHIELTLDTGKMGLWPGGAFILHAEPIWGGGIDKKVGALLPTNTDAALPGSAEPGFGLDEGGRMLLSEFIYQQVLFEGKLILVGGKLFGARAFDTNAFANNERTQFLNIAFRNNPMIPGFLPYTTMGIGAIVNPTEWLSVMTAVADSSGRAKTTGFETAFHGPADTTVIHEWSFKIKPFDQPGTQRVGFCWSSKDFPTVQPKEPFKSTAGLAIQMLGLDNALKVVGLLADFENGKDNVMVYYNFDQYLYTEANDPTQGIGLFGRFGWARQDVNKPAHFYSIGMGGKGVVPDRDHDTCGLAYYFLDLSNDLPSVFHSEQGIECYYNFEVTPWMHITPDLQIIVNPGGTDFNDVAVVYGLRMEMNL